MTTRELILNEIAKERNRQSEKFGAERGYDNLSWLAVLAEEFGEVAANVTKFEVPPESEMQHLTDLQIAIGDELVHVAAVCVAWLEAIGNGEI